MTSNHAENMALGQLAQAAAQSISTQLHWVPFFAARPRNGAGPYHFDRLDKIVVATAEGHSLVIGLLLRDNNNTSYKPLVALGYTRLQTMKCKVVPQANRSAATETEIQVERGNTVGLLKVPLGTEVGVHEVTVAGRTIKVNVPVEGEVVTEHSVMLP